MSFSSKKFAISALDMDFLIGFEASSLKKKIQYYEEKIDTLGEKEKNFGILVSEKDPKNFTAAFFATLGRSVPVILANFQWGETEWKDFFNQFSPALVFGDVELRNNSKAKPINKEISGQLIFIPSGGSSKRGHRFVIHSWETLCAQSMSVQTFIGGGSLHSICCLPLYHVSGLMQIVRAVITEGQILLSQISTLDADLNLIIKSKALDIELFCLSVVPTQLERLLKKQSLLRYIANLKAIFLGGAAIQKELLIKACEEKLPVVMTYGMTETAGMVFAQNKEAFLLGEISVGNPLKDVSVEFIEDGGFKRIKVFSKSLFKGYWGGSLNRCLDGFLTNDYGSLDDNKRLQIEGRMDNWIISGGEKINPKEVEACIGELNIIKDVMVVGKPHLEWGELAIALIVLKENLMQQSAASTIRAYAKKKLATHKIPKHIIFTKNLPFQENGKLDKAALEILLKLDQSA